MNLSHLKFRNLMSRSRAGNARDVKNISFHSRTAAALHAVKGDGEGDEANTELLLNGDVDGAQKWPDLQ